MLQNQAKKIETLWPREVTDTRVLTHFQSTIHKDF